MSEMVELPSEEQTQRIAELSGPASDPRLRGKMAKEIVPLVISGEVSAEEAGAFLLARAVRKYA